MFGLAAGTVGSGIGAAQAIQFHEIGGAFAGIALALNGLLTAFVVPRLVYFGPAEADRGKAEANRLSSRESLRGNFSKGQFLILGETCRTELEA